MKTELPQDNQTIFQANRGEKSGTIFASWNLDLTSNAPKIRVSPRTIVLNSSDTISTIDTPIAFARNAAASLTVDHYFAVCNQAIMIAPASTLVFVEDHQANSPTSNLSRLYSDAIDVNGSLAVSISNDISMLQAGTWVASWWTGVGGSALTASTPHPLCFGFTKEFLIGNGNKVASCNSGGGSPNDARLTLDTNYEVVWIRSGSFAYWIGARHLHGGEGKVFKWDGASQYVINEYGIEGATIPFSCVIKNETPYVVTSNGILLEFNGGGFQEVARFPIANSKVNILADGFTTYPININRNGMTLIDNNVHILVNAGINSTTSTFLENMLSGIWEYTKETGLYHKYSISKDNSSTPSNTLDYGSPRLKQAGALFPLGTVNKFLAGAQLYKADGDSTTTEIGVINYISADARPKMGYFITPQVYTQEIDEVWQKAYVKFKGLINAGDTITLKYRRFTNFRPLTTSSASWVGTWTSTTGFTTTADVGGINIGDEIEILSGEGAGLSAKITAVVSGSPSSMTIDTAVTGASGTFQFRISNWNTIDSATAQGYIYSTTPQLEPTYKEFSIEQNSNLTQYKVLLYGSGSAAVDFADSPEVERLVILSQPQLKEIA